MDHLDHWREAVGGARGRGEDLIDRGIVGIFIASHHDVRDATFDGRGHDDSLGTGLEVWRQGLDGPPLSTAFKHDVDVEFSPRDVARFLVR